MDWSDSWRGAFRIELRAEAIGLASRGWPVLPGTYPTELRWAGRDGDLSAGPVPLHDDWARGIPSSPQQVAEWWSGRPYSLLAATGTVLSAIEVDDQLGRRTAAVLRAAGGPVPIVATPEGQWLFLTESGGSRRELRDTESVILHGEGSWIPLPPTPYQHGIAHWRVKPEVCGWRLPEAELVQDAVVRALHVSTELAMAVSKAA
ncbi:MAG: bifunctional DNA primase/polymerase [Sciscionella sp.]